MFLRTEHRIRHYDEKRPAHLVLLRISELRFRHHVEHHQHSGGGDSADQVSGNGRLSRRRRNGAAAALDQGSHSSLRGVRVERCHSLRDIGVPQKQQRVVKLGEGGGQIYFSEATKHGTVTLAKARVSECLLPRKNRGGGVGENLCSWFRNKPTRAVVSLVSLVMDMCTLVGGWRDLCIRRHLCTCCACLVQRAPPTRVV